MTRRFCTPIIFFLLRLLLIISHFTLHILYGSFLKKYNVWRKTVSILVISHITPKNLCKYPIEILLLLSTPYIIIFFQREDRTHSNMCTLKKIIIKEYIGLLLKLTAPRLDAYFSPFIRWVSEWVNKRMNE